MSKTASERLADGDYTAENWRRNDPHTHPAAREGQTYGEWTPDEWQAAEQRVLDERKRERWALVWD